MKKVKDSKFKGYRTYMAIGAIIATIAASSLGEITILSPEVTNSIVVLLGALAAYFRSKA